MKVPGCKFMCKVCSDGRIYSGGWGVEDVIPNPLPDNCMVFDEFPEDWEDGGSHYVWDGEKLVYSPLTPEQLAVIQSGGELKC